MRMRASGRGGPEEGVVADLARGIQGRTRSGLFIRSQYVQHGCRQGERKHSVAGGSLAWA